MGGTGKFVEPSLCRVDKVRAKGQCSVQFSFIFFFFLVLFIFIHYMLPNQKSLSGINRNETWKIEEPEQVSRLSAKVVKFLGQSRLTVSRSLYMSLSFSSSPLTLFSCLLLTCISHSIAINSIVCRYFDSFCAVIFVMNHLQSGNLKGPVCMLQHPADRAMQRCNCSELIYQLLPLQCQHDKEVRGIKRL